MVFSILSLVTTPVRVFLLARSSIVPRVCPYFPETDFCVSTVLARAISRRWIFKRSVFSSLPMLAWNRMLKRLASISLTFVAMMSAAISRSSRALALAIFIHLANLDSDGQLLGGDRKGLHRQRPIHPAHFEQDAAGQNHGHPAFHVALAGAHAGFRGLLGEGFVRIHADPDASAALDFARHGHPGRFELAVRDPSRFEGLDSEFAEGQRGASGRNALHLSALHLTILDSLWAKH